MKITNNLDRKSKNNLKVGLILLLAFFILWYVEPVSSFLVSTYAVIRPILLGFAIAFVINLPMNFFQEKVFGRLFDPKKHRKLILILSLIFSWLIFFGAVTLILLVIVPETINASQTAIKNIPAFADALIKYTEKIPTLNKAIVDIRNQFESFDLNDISDKITSYLSGEGSNVLNRAQSILSSVSSTLIAIAMGFIFSIYVSINKKNLKINANKFLYANFDESRADTINYLCKLTYDAFAKFLDTRFLSCLALGVFNYIGMKILQLPYAGMISILVGALDIIPYFGPIIAAAFGMLMIFIRSPFQSLVFIIFLVILQQVQENIFYPLVIGKHSGLPAIWIFVSVFLGGRLFGIMGMILFMPLATVFYTLKEDRTIRKLKEKEVDEQSLGEKANKSFEQMRKERLEEDFTKEEVEQIM